MFLLWIKEEGLEVYESFSEAVKRFVELDKEEKVVEMFELVPREIPLLFIKDHLRYFEVRHLEHGFIWREAFKAHATGGDKND